MPAPYGVTADGFSRPSVQELIALVEASQRAEISATIDVSTDSVVGQLNAIFCQQLGVTWEAVEAAYHAFDPDRAEDDALVSLAKLTGTEKRGESKSTVEAAVTLGLGVLLEAGTHFAHVEGKEDVRFTPAADFTAPGPSDPAVYLVTFEAETAGPVQAPATTLNVIATPVVGWSAITNAEDALVGRDSDSNAELRLRREQGLAIAGSSGVDQIRSDVLDVADVTTCQVFENWTDVVDSQGLPAKSFQVVLWDDASADDDAIAQAIWDSKPGGIRSFGAESGTATDANGDAQIMNFDRATEVPIYISFGVTPKAGYVGDAALKLAVANNLDAAMSTGQTLSEWDVADAAHGLGAKLTDICLGTAPSPTTDDDVPIGNTSIARFDTSRISIAV